MSKQKQKTKTKTPSKPLSAASPLTASEQETLLRRLGPWSLIVALVVLFVWDSPTHKDFINHNTATSEAIAMRQLVVVSSSGSHTFTVELAETPATREKGLMDRDHLPEDAGMLFDFGEVAPAYMWMKNTRIPLDMLFIDPYGAITKIATGEPYSENVIPSDTDVRGVLEIAGGRAQDLGITTGDLVYFLPFTNMQPAPPEPVKIEAPAKIEAPKETPKEEVQPEVKSPTSNLPVGTIPDKVAPKLDVQPENKVVPEKAMPPVDTDAAKPENKEPSAPVKP